MTQTKDPANVQEEQEFEHGSNTFGFFHRYQKVIIYTAGIFTLLTFSITAAITDFFDQLGRETRFASMTVPGLGEVMVTEEDRAIAQGIRLVRSSVYTLGYLAPLGVGESEHQYTDQLAALRAIAVSAGIDASQDDVDLINNSAISSFPTLTSIMQLANGAKTNDITLYNMWMREALRVSTFLRLAVLGVDQTSQAALEAVLDKNEMVSFEVAYLDTKAYKGELEKALTDDVLKKFLDKMEKNKAERYRKPANRVSIKVAMLEDGAFQHEKYLGVEIDKQVQIGDTQVQERYQLHREDRYKKPVKPQEAKKPAGTKKSPAAVKKPAEAKKTPASVKKPAEAKTKPAAVKKSAEAKKKSAAVKKSAEAKKKSAGDKGKGDENKGNGSVDPLAEGSGEQQGEAKQGAAKGEAKQGAAKGEAKQGAAKGEAKQGAAKGEAKQGAAKGEAKQDAAKGEAKQDAAKGEGKQDAPEGEVKQDQGYFPLDDALRKKIKEQLFAEMVLSKWQASLDRAMAEHMHDSINAATAADIAVEEARQAKAKADAALDANADDAALQKTAETAKTEFEAAEKAAKAAGKAVDARRVAFNFKTEITKLANGRPGLKFIVVDKMQDAEGLRNLADVGDWRDSHLPGQLTLAGEIYNGRVQNTQKGSFIFQVSSIEERPFKDFKDIKDDLQDEYLAENSEKYSKDKKKLFEEAIEKLSRDKLKDAIAKLEKEAKDKIQTDFEEWKKNLDADVAKIEELLKSLGDKNLVAYKRKAAQLEAVKTELAGADEKKKTLAKIIDKETDEKIDEKLKDAHKDVLAAAGKTAGFKVETLGPLSREVQNLPRFQYRYSNVIRAVFGANAADAKADDVTGLEEDSINEVTFMALCSKVGKADAKQISRRQWLTELRGSGFDPKSFAGNRMRKAVDLSFTIDALTKGYGWRPPAGLPSEKGLAAGLDKDKGSKDEDAKDKDTKDKDAKKSEDKGPDAKTPGKDGGK